MYKKMRDIRLAALRLTLCSTSLALVAVLSAC